jgi:hypothetical protein
MKIEAYPEAEYLRMVVRGDYSLEEAKRTFLELLDEIARRQVLKVFIDGRPLEGEPETIERFYFGKFCAEAVWSYRERGVAPFTQFAVVLVEPVLDPNRLGETTAVNRGMFIKAFANVVEAYEWLGITTAGNKEKSGV